MDRSVGLAPLALSPLPLGAIRPRGWLRDQLRIQADGLSGHLDEFWPDIADSAWIGGRAEGWERGPYWLDGIVPLAYLLDDALLKAKAQSWIDYILAHQAADGWLGPVRGGERYREYDPWPQFVVFKALTQYEAATGDARIVPAMIEALEGIGLRLKEQPLFDWGRFRWADLAVSIHWLYERVRAGWLLELCARAREQGYDWRAHFAPLQFTGKVAPEQCDLRTHVVNNAMGVKQPGVWYRQSMDAGDRNAVFQILASLDAYHGQATGVFTGDEHFAGRNPSQGTELCAVVELMYSLEVLISILGEPALADRLERVAFNALPAAFKPDMWAHQYDQQANQVICRVAEDRVYTSNGPDANIFGLAPNYGCCTANMHQGWPKFVTHLWMESTDGGLVAVAYAPCRIETTIAGVHVSVEVETEYPFGESIRIVVEVAEPVTFPLMLRIPAWASGAVIGIEGGVTAEAVPGSYHRVARQWHGATTVTMHLPMEPRIERRYRGSVAIQRGPLAYSLRIEENWRLIGGLPPHGDWEVHPTSPWNYGLHVGRQHCRSQLRFESRGVRARPFSPEGAPMVAHVKGRRVPSWTIEHGAAAAPPQSPVHSSEPITELELIPYGCSNLRVTEFPVLAD